MGRRFWDDDEPHWLDPDPDPDPGFVVMASTGFDTEPEVPYPAMEELLNVASDYMRRMSTALEPLTRALAGFNRNR